MLWNEKCAFVSRIPKTSLHDSEPCAILKHVLRGDVVNRTMVIFHVSGSVEKLQSIRYLFIKEVS